MSHFVLVVPCGDGIAPLRAGAWLLRPSLDRSPVGDAVPELRVPAFRFCRLTARDAVRFVRIDRHD